MPRALIFSALVLFIGSSALAQQPRRRQAPDRSSMRRGEQAQQRGRSMRTPDRLREGDIAPDFTLKSPDGKQTVTLSDFRGKRPVALVFGSYT